MYPKSSSQWFSRGLLVAALLLMLVFSVLPAAAQSRAETYHAITFYAPGAIDPETHEPWATEGKVENVLDGTAIRFPQHPTRTGYRYMGWYTEPNGGGTLVEGMSIRQGICLFMPTSFHRTPSPSMPPKQRGRGASGPAMKRSCRVSPSSCRQILSTPGISW